MEARGRRRTPSEREEVLECLWMLEEEGKREASLEDIKRCLKGLPCEVAELEKVASNLEKEGLVERSKEGRLSLSGEGRAEAREIIRRHRLAERLLSDVLDMPFSSVEAGACRLEHALDPEVTDAVCTFLGHPKTCPHGKPVPPGPCCERFEREVRPITLPLSELEPGERARVVFITPSVHARLDRLASLGLVPGAAVKLHQRRPSVVVNVGETQLAIGHDIAREIYVRPIREEGEGSKGENKGRRRR